MNRLCLDLLAHGLEYLQGPDRSVFIDCEEAVMSCIDNAGEEKADFDLLNCLHAG